MRVKTNVAYRLTGALMVGTLVLLMIVAVGKAYKVLPDTICFRAKDNCGVTIDKVEDISFIAGEWSEEGRLTTEFLTIPQEVFVCYTTSAYGDLASIRMKAGNYFWVDEMPEYNQKAIISDTLAIRLFGTDQIVGEEIKLNGESYQVYGIYEEPKGFLADCCKEGEEKIYVPYSNYKSEEGQEIPKPDIIYVRNEEGRMEEALADEITEMAGMPFSYDEVTDYAQGKRILKQNLLVPFFFLLVALFINGVRKTAGIVGKKGKHHTVPMKVTAVAAVACLGCLLLFCVWKGIQIPDWILPEDDILDVRHYQEAISEMIVRHRAIGKTDFYWNYKSVMTIFTSIGSIFVSFSIVSTEILKGLMSAFSHK